MHSRLRRAALMHGCFGRHGYYLGMVEGGGGTASPRMRLVWHADVAATVALRESHSCGGVANGRGMGREQRGQVANRPRSPTGSATPSPHSGRQRRLYRRWRAGRAVPRRVARRHKQQWLRVTSPPSLVGVAHATHRGPAPRRAPSQPTPHAPPGLPPSPRPNRAHRRPPAVPPRRTLMTRSSPAVATPTGDVNTAARTRFGCSSDAASSPVARYTLTTLSVTRR